MSKLDKYLHIPFKACGRTESGADCWGLVYLFYKWEYGIELKSYAEIDPKSQMTIAKLIEIHKKFWQRMDSPEEGDVVIMRSYNRRGSTWSHLGIVVNLSPGVKGVLHTEIGDRNAHTQRLDDPIVRSRIKEFRRYCREE